MRTMKKWLSLFLALAMCLSVAMPVLATADTKSISAKPMEGEATPEPTKHPAFDTLADGTTTFTVSEIAQAAAAIVSHYDTYKSLETDKSIPKAVIIKKGETSYCITDEAWLYMAGYALAGLTSLASSAQAGYTGTTAVIYRDVLTQDKTGNTMATPSSKVTLTAEEYATAAWLFASGADASGTYTLPYRLKVTSKLYMSYYAALIAAARALSTYAANGSLPAEVALDKITYTHTDSKSNAVGGETTTLAPTQEPVVTDAPTSAPDGIFTIAELAQAAKKALAGYTTGTPFYKEGVEVDGTTVTQANYYIIAAQAIQDIYNSKTSATYAKSAYNYKQPTLVANYTLKQNGATPTTATKQFYMNYAIRQTVYVTTGGGAATGAAGASAAYPTTDSNANGFPVSNYDGQMTYEAALLMFTRVLAAYADTSTLPESVALEYVPAEATDAPSTDPTTPPASEPTNPPTPAPTDNPASDGIYTIAELAQASKEAVDNYTNGMSFYNGGLMVDGQLVPQHVYYYMVAQAIQDIYNNNTSATYTKAGYACNKYTGTIRNYDLKQNGATPTTATKNLYMNFAIRATVYVRGNGAGTLGAIAAYPTTDSNANGFPATEYSGQLTYEAGILMMARVLAKYAETNTLPDSVELMYVPDVDPSTTPTQDPTPAPTPTENPTDNPTAAPTVEPTVEPTQEPVVTDAPTSAPDGIFTIAELAKAANDALNGYTQGTPFYKEGVEVDGTTVTQANYYIIAAQAIQDIYNKKTSATYAKSAYNYKQPTLVANYTLKQNGATPTTATQTFYMNYAIRQTVYVTTGAGAQSGAAGASAAYPTTDNNANGFPVSDYEGQMTYEAALLMFTRVLAAYYANGSLPASVALEYVPAVDPTDAPSSNPTPTPAETEPPTVPPVVTKEPTKTEEPTQTEEPTIAPTETPKATVAPTEKPESGAIKFTEESGIYSTKDGYIFGVEEETTLEELRESIAKQGFILTFKDKDGNALAEDGMIGTGASVEVLDEYGDALGTYEFVVKGDITGDAKINSRDIASLQKHVLGISELKDAFALAADVTERNNGATTINSSDIAQLQKHVAGFVDFIFVVVDAEGNETTKNMKSTRKYVGDALMDAGLISGDETEYGLFVKTVNGITSDFENEGTYWAFYVNGAYAQTGVDSTLIKDNFTYTFKLEKYEEGNTTPDATVEPTLEPVVTDEPTVEPTQEPTVEPTVEPTQEPVVTDEPTTAPDGVYTIAEIGKAASDALASYEEGMPFVKDGIVVDGETVPQHVYYYILAQAIQDINNGNTSATYTKAGYACNKYTGSIRNYDLKQNGSTPTTATKNLYINFAIRATVYVKGNGAGTLGAIASYPTSESNANGYPVTDYSGQLTYEVGLLMMNRVLAAYYANGTLPASVALMFVPDEEPSDSPSTPTEPPVVTDDPQTTPPTGDGEAQPTAHPAFSTVADGTTFTVAEIAAAADTIISHYEKYKELEGEYSMAKAVVIGDKVISDEAWAYMAGYVVNGLAGDCAYAGSGVSGYTSSTTVSFKNVGKANVDAGTPYTGTLLGLNHVAEAIWKACTNYANNYGRVAASCGSIEVLGPSGGRQLSYYTIVLAAARVLKHYNDNGTPALNVACDAVFFKATDI